MFYKISALFLLFTISVTSQNGLLQSGPMVGYCEMKEAMIWLQTTKPANVCIEYYTLDNPKTVFKSENFTTTKEVGYTYHIILDQLQEGKKYNYTILINNKRVILPYETSFSSKKLWQWRGEAPDFSMALGSCNYVSETELDRPGNSYGSGFEIFNKIADKNPNIMVWGGDNMYLREADWDSKTGIYHRYSHSRKLKEMQPLLAKTQNFAIWDDHDYGPNDADRGFYLKHQTHKAFKDFWANKTYGIKPEQNEATYSTFSWGDAQFFLLDNRWYKSPNDLKTSSKVLLGNEQLQWLVDNLVTSNAVFKVIVIGGQTLNSEAIYENYENYKQEKDLLLKEIKDNKIKGVLFISGDRHFSELAMLNRENTYPLYDWTVSPLTSGVATAVRTEKEPNTNRVSGSMFNEHNFGMIYFSGTKADRQMKLTLYNREGNELWNKVILKKELE